MKTVATTINTIRDNIEIGEDNADNYVQLNQLKDEIDKLMQSSESKNIANRLKNDYIQCLDMWQKIQLIVIKIMSLGYTGIGERIGKEIDRVAPRVENEVKRSVDKIAKEAKRFFRKF